MTAAALYRQNHVFGDLRSPNIVVFVDENGNEFAMLLYFDWGAQKELLYKVSNMEIGRHAKFALED
jgi:galactokinase/mevalonate kinase-like predicted kinase